MRLTVINFFLSAKKFANRLHLLTISGNHFLDTVVAAVAAATQTQHQVDRGPFPDSEIPQTLALQFFP